MTRSIAIVILTLGALISAFALPPQWGAAQGNRPADVYANGKDYFLGQVVVQFNRVLPDIYNPDGTPVISGNKELDNLCTKYNVYFLRNLVPWEKLPNDGNIDCRWIYWLQFDPQKSLENFLTDLQKLSCVRFAEPNYIRSLDFVPNDPRYTYEWHLNQINCPSAWDNTTGDSTIIISICDSGIDMVHEDLVSNLWVNPGEDLNHNGIVDATDRNSVDNDNNTLVDDFWGWDWTSGDNNPQDNTTWMNGGGHGTHVAGCADARSNNGLGVASPAGVSRLMVHRIAPSDADPTHISSAFGLQAWSYSRNKGANILNNSWGGGNWAQVEQNVLTSCYNAGMLVFCAAGNDNVETLHYPAGYQNVISVAATTTGDRKATFSNYGTWVKISAPGEHILSTIYSTTHTGYDYADGTSMACPVAAGATALIWSVMPGAANNTVRDVMYQTSTNINGINPLDSGKLGAGRIDVNRAIASQIPTDSLVLFAIRDTLNGIPNGRAEPGDTVCVAVSTYNPSNHVAGTAAYFKLYLNDPNLVPIVDSVYIGARPSGSSIGTNRLKFYVPWGTLSHRINIQVVAGGRNPYTVPYRNITSQSTMIGWGNVLIIDDDGTMNYETYYQTALDSINKSWDTWHVTTQGVPDTVLMNHYNNFIWFTGDRMTNVLTATEQNAIIWLQQRNKRLLFSSQGAGGDMGTTQFHAQWLHAGWSGSTTDRRAIGIAGDPVSQGRNMLMVGAGGGGASNMQTGNLLTPSYGSTVCFNYGPTGGNAAVYVGNASHVSFVYCGFPVEAINANGSYISQAIFLQQVLSTFDDVAEPISNSIPTSYALNTPYPNPFNPSTTMRFSLPMAGFAKLAVFDITGREIANLTDGYHKAGAYSVTWNATGVASGMYFIRLYAGNQTMTRKVMLVK